MNKHHKTEGSGLGKTVVGLGAAAALIGTYLFYGSKKGPERRRKVRGWMFKMKGEVMDEIENLKDVTEDAYYKVIDEVKARYKKMHNVTEEDVDDVAQELKNSWVDISNEAKEGKEEIEEDIKDAVDKPKRKPRKTI